jgi:alanine racemase
VFLLHGLTLTTCSIDKLRQIDAAARDLGVTATVHLKIDMGMGRISGPLCATSCSRRYSTGLTGRR